MHPKKVETIIVMPKDVKPIGIVTERDALDKVVINGIDPDEIFLKDIMTSPIITLSTKSRVRDALETIKSTETANPIDCIKMCSLCSNKKMTLKMK